MALSNSSSLLMTYGVLFFLFIAFGIDCIIYLFVYLFNVCIFCCYRTQTESWPKKEKKKNYKWHSEETLEDQRFISRQQVQKRVISQDLSPEHRQSEYFIRFYFRICASLAAAAGGASAKPGMGLRPELGFSCWTGQPPQNTDFPYHQQKIAL